MSAEQGYANPAALVSTDWVAEHLNDPNVRLIEVDVDTTAYEGGHIQGAVGINWTTQLGDPIRRDIPSKEAWADLLGKAGASNDTRLVFYGDNNNWFAAFAYWVSKIYGHQNAALMNGGRKKWELENRAVHDRRRQSHGRDLHRPATPTCRCGPILTGRPGPSAVRQWRWWTCARRPSSTARSSPRPACPRRRSAPATSRAPPTSPGPRPPTRTAPSSPPTSSGALRRQGRHGGQGRHRLLPHRRALLAHLVRAEGAAGLPERQATTTARGPSTAPWSASPSKTPPAHPPRCNSTV